MFTLNVERIFRKDSKIFPIVKEFLFDYNELVGGVSYIVFIPISMLIDFQHLLTINVLVDEIFHMRFYLSITGNSNDTD